MSKKDYLYGIHAVTSALELGSQRINKILIQKGLQKAQHLIDLARTQGIDLDLIPKSDLERLSKGKNHQGIVAEVSYRQAGSEQDLVALLDSTQGPVQFLILDSITDPHNLGACLRTGDATNITGIIVPKDKSASITATVSKVACGAAETVPLFQVTNLSRTLELLKSYNIWVYGLAGETKTSLYETDFESRVALVMGSEGKGLRPNTKKHCDFLIKIPMLGHVESLNVSVATGVTLYEVLRQHHKSRSQ